MDRVRFGRALGKGARLAARTAVEAAQAAASPGPASSTTASRPRTSGASSPPAPQILPPQATTRQYASAAPRQERQAIPTANLGPAVKAAGAGMLGPLRGASRALWHELTGSFFALFALSFGLGAWKTRANIASAVPGDRQHFYAFCALALLFAYFSVSSFLRARKKTA